MTTEVTDSTAVVEEPTITLEADAPAASAAAAPVVEDAATAAAEEARRAALTDEERKGEDDAKAAEAAKHAPTEYADFTVPEGVKLQGEIVDSFKDIAKNFDLPQDKAQQIIDLGIKMTEKFGADQQAAILATQKSWAAESKADKEFGGEKLKENIAIAESGINAFASPELRTILKDSGLANHKEVIRHFFRLGKQVQSDKTLIATTETGKARDETPEARADRLYGGTKAA